VNTWKIIFATIVIFGAGVITGALLSQRARPAKTADAPPAARPGSQPQSASAGGMRLEFLRRIQGDLNLTEEQRERIDKILKDGQERARRIIHDEVHQIKEEFRQALTPAQQAHFDELVRQQQQSREQHRSPASHSTNSAPSTNAP